MTGVLEIIGAFTAGVLSFLSPCVLPLVPGYLSFITGYSVNELSEEDRKTSRVLTSSILFVLGFSVVFVSLGATASILGATLLAHRESLQIVSGAIIILLGFFLLGLIRAPWLYAEARFDMGKARHFGSAAALVTGMAFAFGWTPCVGPILGAILVQAGSAGSMSYGAGLLFVYSMGLGLPLILVGLLFGRARASLDWFKKRSLVINRIAGVLLMSIGALIVSGRLSAVTGWLTGLLP